MIARPRGAGAFALTPAERQSGAAARRGAALRRHRQRHPLAREPGDAVFHRRAVGVHVDRDRAQDRRPRRDAQPRRQRRARGVGADPGRGAGIIGQPAGAQRRRDRAGRAQRLRQAGKARGGKGGPKRRQRRALGQRHPLHPMRQRARRQRAGRQRQRRRLARIGGPGLGMGDLARRNAAPGVRLSVVQVFEIPDNTARYRIRGWTRRRIAARGWACWRARGPSYWRR